MDYYEKLVNELRERAEKWRALKYDNIPDERLLTQAADAIEDLSERAESLAETVEEAFQFIRNKDRRIREQEKRYEELYYALLDPAFKELLYARGVIVVKRKGER